MKNPLRLLPPSGFNAIEHTAKSFYGCSRDKGILNQKMKERKNYFREIYPNKTRVLSLVKYRKTKIVEKSAKRY